MKTKEFLMQVGELLRGQLPPDLQEFQTIGPMASLVKFHYGEPRIHYEVWVQRRAGLVEVGLHFEADAATNQWYLERMTKDFDISSALGSGVEAEQWTDSWTRIHEIVPMEALDEDLLFEVTSHLARLMNALEPAVRGVKNHS